MLKTLRACRKLKGLTQDQVAELAGISQNAYSEIELGHYMPRLYVAMKISLVLESPINNLFREIANQAKNEVLENKKNRQYKWIEENIGDWL